MRIEIHAAVPTRFQDTKPTVESNELQTNQLDLHRSPFVQWFAAQLPVRSLRSSDARIVFDNRIGDVQPVVAIASHLKALNHEVGVLSAARLPRVG